VRTSRVGPLFVYEWGEDDAPALLYWDGLGGTGLHANEIGPLLADEHGLRVIAPDPPGHGRSPAVAADELRPSRLATMAAALLSELGVEQAAFLGFSWGARVGCWFAARFPDRVTALALVEGGHHGSLPPTGLDAAIAEARAEREDETFDGWEAYFTYERESLRRWTPELEEAHRSVMVEEDGCVAPILSAEALGAINQGSRLEPLAEAYPLIAAAGVPVLLVVASGLASESVARFRAALPEARVEGVPDAIHDLISFAPSEVVRLVGIFAASRTRLDQPPP
jgi:pimeloyl-ACP methyl ester carboxylesterase